MSTPFEWIGPLISTSRAMFTGPSTPGYTTEVTRHGRPNMCGPSKMTLIAFTWPTRSPCVSTRIVPRWSSSYTMSREWLPRRCAASSAVSTSMRSTTCLDARSAM